MHADPTLLRRPSVAAAFLPTPWLLPHSPETSRILPYGGLHNDLDGLLAARAARFDLSPGSLGGGLGLAGYAGPSSSGSSNGNASKEMKGAVSVVFFSRSHAVMLQNWVYTAVRWVGAGVQRGSARRG